MNGAEGGQPAENRGLTPVHAVSCPAVSALRVPAGFS